MVELNGRDGSAEELDRETVEEQTTLGRTRRKDGGRHYYRRERQSYAYVSRAGGDEGGQG